jgi:hypothetical protein
MDWQSFGVYSMKSILSVSGVFLGLCFSLICTSCLTPSIPIQFHSDPDQMEKEISQSIPPGTLITDTEKIMQQNGLTCEYQNNVPYGKSRYVRTAYNSRKFEVIWYPASDILSCSKRNSYVIGYVEWIIIVPYKNQRVSNSVAVSRDSIWL